MQEYKRGSHTVLDCKYHLVWTTKYRYQVLGGEVGLRCRELLREIAMSKEMLTNPAPSGGPGTCFCVAIRFRPVWIGRHCPAPQGITVNSRNKKKGDPLLWVEGSDLSTFMVHKQSA